MCVNVDKEHQDLEHVWSDFCWPVGFVPIYVRVKNTSLHDRRQGFGFGFDVRVKKIVIEFLDDLRQGLRISQMSL